MSMIRLTAGLAGFLLYLEIIYHLSGFGLTGCMPAYTVALIAAWSGIWSLVIGLCRGILKKIIFYAVIWFYTIWAGAQIVYLGIFKQPLLWEGIFRGGQDALTNYWREALAGIWQMLPFLALVVLPGVLLGILMHHFRVKLPDLGVLEVLRLNVVICVGIVGEITVMEIGKTLEADYYEGYSDFYDPLGVARGLGFLPMLQRDTYICMTDGGKELWDGIVARFSREPERSEGQAAQAGAAKPGENPAQEIPPRETDPQSTLPGDAQEATDSSGAQEGSGSQGAPPSQEGTQTPDGDLGDGGALENTEPGKHEMKLDFSLLRELSDSEEKLWLADYIEAEEPALENEYTGLFEEYNLIFLTAEGFSPYAVREDLTPTLYRLVNSGFVFENYYVPLWQTSTSDGEYINCTGLIPDRQFSMRKSASNEMPFTLPAFFARERVDSLAYHNNSLSYYDRYLTHPNLGYDFKGCRLGSLSEEEWGDKIFPMENPDAWPASDLEMLQGTVPEYINKSRFHVYYMTVSGHMNYNFTGNAMAAKNREAVSGLEMSENARAYIACHIELDKALEYLLERLSEAGALEKTVICLSADHYPYGMTKEQYEELAGTSLSQGMDLYRNSLILWNSQMEEEPVVVEKACGPMDLLPTLLNLFGFSYDSRMYAGRDIFSPEEGLVIFNDRSFVTDSVIYNKTEKQMIWLTDENGNFKVPEEEQESYLEQIEQEVKDRYQFSAYVLQTNYYSDILKAQDAS